MRPLLGSITDEARGSPREALSAAEPTLRRDKVPFPALSLLYGKLLSLLKGVFHLGGHEACRLTERILFLCLNPPHHYVIREGENDGEFHLPNVFLLDVEPIFLAEFYTFAHKCGLLSLY